MLILILELFLLYNWILLIIGYGGRVVDIIFCSWNTNDNNLINFSKTNSRSIRPELSIDGLINLLNMVESDMQDAFSLEGYYRSSWPDTARKNDIIR